jgi:chlorobactene glucosyltransferase
MLLYYQLVATAAMLCVLLTSLYNLRTMPRLPGGGSLPQPLPLVSVLIPARDEERNIRACLEALLAQDYPLFEILVLDDDSADATSCIVQEIATYDKRVRMLKGLPLPSGWHGKTWACHQLSQEANGEWLLFVDADTRLRPNTISAALALAASRHLDLLSLLPVVTASSFLERTIMSVIPLLFVACSPHSLFTKTRIPVLVAAIGTFMLFRREVYNRFGGHEAVRSDIVEDIFIARWVKRVGGRVALADGVEAMRVQFYSGFQETWQGLSKSAFATLDYSLIGMFATLAFFSTLFIGPFGFLYWAWTSGLGDLAHFSLPLLQIVLAWIAMWLVDGRFAIPRRYALLTALTVAMMVVCCLNSVASTLLGAGTVWKGRAYQFRGH